MRALITGISGFVGRYLARNLQENGYEVWGGTRIDSASFIDNVNMVTINFASVESIETILEKIQPDMVFHLAGQSSVKDSWQQIHRTFESNLMLSLNLLEAIRSYNDRKAVRLIIVGSSEEYGVIAQQPIDEKSMPNPGNPYGMSKLALGKAAMYYAQSYGLDIIHARPFNHIGPGQKLGFVTSDFAKQIVDIENTVGNSTIFVGNLNSKRDFTDVRDIVEAYRMIAEKGETKEVYNICSNKSVSIEEILKTLVSFSSKEINIQIDPTKFRPVDVPEYFGSNSKVHEHTGWSPSIELKQSLIDIYMYWKGKRDINETR